MAASGGDKVGQRCVGWDGKVRRRTNPRSGDARRGANTSLSTLPAVSGGNSTTVMGRWLRPRLSTPSPAVRRLRTQLELSWRWVETRKLRPLRSAIAKQERVRLPERTRAGLERVRREGKRLGRPVAKVDSAAIRRMREQGESWSEIARRTGLSRGTVQKLACERQPRPRLGEDRNCPRQGTFLPRHVKFPSTAHKKFPQRRH